MLKAKWIKGNSKNSTALLKELVAKFEQSKLDSTPHGDESNRYIPHRMAMYEEYAAPLPNPLIAVDY